MLSRSRDKQIYYFGMIRSKNVPKTNRIATDLLQIPPSFLFSLNGFEECLKVVGTETLGTFALDDLEKQRRAVLYRSCTKMISSAWLFL
jgi:hypothetical protein